MEDRAPFPTTRRAAHGLLTAALTWTLHRIRDRETFAYGRATTTGPVVDDRNPTCGKCPWKVLLALERCAAADVCSKMR